METKHTPGPWSLLTGAAVQIGTDRIIASTNPDYELARADANLIAAAPDLLAALETTLAICTHRWRALPSDAPEKAAIEAARAAIAKATA